MKATAQAPSTSLLRYGLLTVLFCAFLAAEALSAKFALLTGSELHAYWLGGSGQFPFTVLSWSETHFGFLGGGDALAMRVPLIVLGALVVGSLLLFENQRRKTAKPLMLIIGTLVLLTGMGVQQYFGLRNARRESREFRYFLSAVERAAGPDETVVADWELMLPLYEYGSSSLRQRLEGEMPNAAGGVPPVGIYGTNGDLTASEFVYVGALSEPLAKRLVARGYQFREDEMAPTDATLAVARYYEAAGASIYFVSPPAAGTVPAVSSKP